MPKVDDPDYRKVAEEIYRLTVDRMKHAATIQADYGKWLLVTVTSIHLGALYAIFSNPKLTISPLPFLVGLLLILASGLCTWINFTISMNDLDTWADPAMIIDSDRWPKHIKHPWRYQLTMFSALTLGVASVICILFAVPLLKP
jgi:hypothetical protein